MSVIEADRLSKIYKEGRFEVPAVEEVTPAAQPGAVLAWLAGKGVGGPGAGARHGGQQRAGSQSE
ncbi:MAG: hypothetical protein AAB328_02745 [candidate division NC10 bacterium]